MAEFNYFNRTKINSMKVYLLLILLHFIIHGNARPPNQKEEEKIHFDPASDKYLLSKDETCIQDVKNLCKSVKKENNFAVFVCLQDAAHKDEDSLSDECHETLWHYKYNLTRDPRFDQAAYKTCESAINTKLLKECPMSSITSPGFLMNCLLEHRQMVDDHSCKQFLMRMSAIVFEDYRLIKGFYDHCEADVKKTNCGSLSKPSEEYAQHEQSEVVSCLEANINELTPQCQEQILKIAELQADDYHLDRPLYYACQEARERFCRDVKSGDGRIYKCLTEHITNDLMSQQCALKLVAREKMVQKDVKVDHSLWSACEADFKKYRCEQQGITEHGAGSNLLLCLQQRISQGQNVDPACQTEMNSFSIQIFENYQLNPIIVAKCEAEIHTHCSKYIGNRDNGYMMDCLMALAPENNSLSEECFTSIAEVLRETGAGSNYKVDRALYLACESAISTLCSGKDDTAVLTCLMDNAHSPKMPEECSAQVFHLQYFMSRDFRLDTELYLDCRHDAEEICHAAEFNEKSESKIPGNFVIACLYRNSLDSSHVKKKVSPICANHIRRVMHQRATNIRLMPELETPCLTDLAKHCIDKVKEGEEIECLQNNYEHLTDKCHEAVKEFTKFESKDFDLDKHLVDKCGPMVHKFCKHELEENQGEKILECLIQNKNEIDMDYKCTNALEHWQLLEMKDLEFSPSLKEYCLNDVLKLCRNSKTKYEAVTCLSENIVKEQTSVSENCRTQIKKELITQSENIKLNPNLFQACQKDIQTFCSNVPYSGAQVEECLRKNHRKLQDKTCKDLLFKQEEMESQDTELDYRMMHVCKSMIKKYCMTYTESHEILQCLRGVTHDREMKPACREIVEERQIEQAESFFLDADLTKNCMQEAKSYCPEELAKAKKGVDDGAVFGCLVNALLTRKKFQPNCETFVRHREVEAAGDKNLNPQFLASCGAEIMKLCSKSEYNEVMECMKENIARIQSKACKEEVKKLIVEGIEDIHVDRQLNDVCARDIRHFCNDMPEENGQVIMCLIDVYNAKNLRLHQNCKNLLAKRMSLYRDAQVEIATFDSISTVLDAIAASPNRNYVYIFALMILSILFVSGLVFGRFTKKIRSDIKNR
ncbi:Golgi apparatus protein 1-like isoform X1 [Hydra vulgaris]|uniref:Golgi apparatus protein 1-like isoform X1 n=1 Tax=Hydra vulgaris TaxID=6087 RepID=A0ABM4DNI5_HYDVU